MYYFYIRYSPKYGTMKSEIIFGILFAAIVAVGAGTLTAVLDPTQAFAQPTRDNPGDPDSGGGNDPPKQSGKQGGQKGQPGREGSSGP